MTFCALAVQRFQNKYQRDPMNLDELVPEFLSAIPRDILGNPLKLKHAPFDTKIASPFYQDLTKSPQLTLMIYSFGANRKNDNGKNTDSSKEIDPDDYSILIRGAASRGKAP